MATKKATKTKNKAAGFGTKPTKKKKGRAKSNTDMSSPRSRY